MDGGLDGWWWWWWWMVDIDLVAGHVAILGELIPFGIGPRCPRELLSLVFTDLSGGGGVAVAVVPWKRVSVSGKVANQVVVVVMVVVVGMASTFAGSVLMSPRGFSVEAPAPMAPKRASIDAY